MKKVPVFTLKQIEEMSAEEFKELIRRRWNSEWPSPARMLPPPRDEIEPHFFVTTKSGSKIFALPPKIVVISGGNS